MGYGIYYRDGRWQGYEVPAECDMPNCHKIINRGLGYKCEDHGHFETTSVYFEEWVDKPGCDLFFCNLHSDDPEAHEEATPKGESVEWMNHLLTDESWGKWRETNPALVKEYKTLLGVAND